MATPAAVEAMARRSIDATELLARHAAGDWGDLDEHDKRENEFSETHRLRILSAYGTPHDPDRIRLITEADRSATTILKPDEY